MNERIRHLEAAEQYPIGVADPNGVVDAAEGTAFWDSVNDELYYNTDGVTAWQLIGGGGVPYGHCYGNEIAWVQNNAVQNTWYDVSDADMISGELNFVIHDGNGQLTVLKAGIYSVDWSGAFEASAANVHIQVTVSVNGTEDPSAMNHFETVGINRQDPCSGFAILSLAATDTVNVSIRTTDVGTPDLWIDHLMLRVAMI